MQTLKMDFQSQSTPPVVPVMQSDAQSRFIGITLYNGGVPYEAPAGASYTVQYRGPGANNMGWYDTIQLSSGTRKAVIVDSASKNVVTLELAEQALRVSGNVFVNLCVVTNTGYMLKTFPILCLVTGASFPDTVAVQSFFYVTGITSEQWLAYVTACQDAQKRAEAAKNRAEAAAAAFQTDPTLSISGKAADAAKVGEEVNQLKEKKVDKPSTTDDGKIPRAKEGEVEWVEVGQPTDDQTNSAVTNWLNEHPEATTTVQDHSLNVNKMVIGTLGYVTPEMFGAKGDGVTDDAEALLRAIATGYPIRGKTGSKYSIKSQLVFSDNCTIKNIYLVANAEIESVIKYSKRNTIIRNVQIDCNNLANYGILGASNVPTDVLYFASIKRCSVVNALIDGYNTGSIRTFMSDCIAKRCGSAGFYIDVSDTKHDNLVPIDCKYGVYVNSGNTSISRFHPWSWEKEQIGLFVGTNCSVSIEYYFNDTNQYAISFSAGVDITIGTLRNFNNINAPSAISDGCRMLVRNEDTNTYIPYITIETICGSFSGYDDYFLYPDNYRIGYMSVQRINLTDVGTRFDKKMFRFSYVPPSLYDNVLKKFSITSNVLTISSCTMQRCKTDLNGYEIRLQVCFETSNATLEPLNEILNIQYIGDDTNTVYYKLLGADASYTGLSFHTARKNNDDNKLKGMTLKCNGSFSLDGILILYLDLYVELYR